MHLMTDQTPFRLHDHALIEVAGSEAAAFLDRLLTVNVSDLAPDSAGYGALLTPQGKIQHEMFVLPTPDGFVLSLPAGDLAAKLLQRLTLMKLRADVTVANASDTRTAVACVGAAPPATIEGLVWAPDPRRPDGERWIGLAAAADAERFDIAAASDDIRAGLPAQGRDYATESVFPTDVNVDLLNGVDYRKGCFVGQEVASRMKRRGSIRKRTLVLALDDAETVPRGADVTSPDGARVGETLSSAGGHALAIVRLDRLAAAGGLGTPLSVGEVAATASFPAYVPDEAKTLSTDGAPA